MKYVHLLVTLYQFNHNARNRNCKQKRCSCSCKNIYAHELWFSSLCKESQNFISLYFFPLQRVSGFQRWNLSGRDVLPYGYVCAGIAAVYIAFMKTYRLKLKACEHLECGLQQCTNQGKDWILFSEIQGVILSYFWAL